jgi:hypothetical protein
MMNSRSEDSDMEKDRQWDYKVRDLMNGFCGIDRFALNDGELRLSYFGTE